MRKPLYITREGLIRLKEELLELKTVKRQEIIERVQEARAHGDLSENAEYADAKEQQAFLEGHILELEEEIRQATIIEDQVRNGHAVTIGSTVRVRNHRDEREFTIVGPSEANPSQGRISNESPLGKAFLDRMVGDKVTVEVPSGKVVYQILSIK
ncbi:MAG: transcription elongation factor GreA [Parcubacteria group bacterium]|nr:transcription elongation factor GreA [Parcubacteria group bacterium]